MHTTIRALQAGRGLAALAVTASHLAIAFRERLGLNLFTELTHRGYLGVDFFFVISGFIILQAHQQDIGRPQALRPYLAKRFVRIYPIYWLYLSLVIAGMLALGSTGMTIASAGDALTAYTLVRFTGLQVPLFQAWTLFHEVVFYALFATLIVSARWGRVLLVAWALAIAALFFYPSMDRADFRETVFAACNLNFFLGMAAHWGAQRAGPRAAGLALALGLGLLLLLGLAEAQHRYIPLLRLNYGIAFAIATAGAVALERHGRWPQMRLLQALGDASYSLYLLHVYLATYALLIAYRLGLNRLLGAEAVFGLVLACTAACGYLAYHWVEAPMLRWLRARLIPAKARKAGDKE